MSARIRDLKQRLTLLVQAGVLDAFEVQSLMPGRRWTLHMWPMTTMVYRTHEAEAWVNGANAALQRQKS
jgi:hypothetical protein